MKKKRQTCKKMMMILLALTLAAGSCITALAERVTFKNVPIGYYAYHRYPDGMVINSTEMSRYFINGKLAFCTQSGRIIRDENGNVMLPGQENSFDTEYTVEQVSQKNSLQSKIAYLGYTRKSSPSTRDYAYTQMFIWQSLEVSKDTANGSDSKGFLSYFSNADTRSDYNTWKKQIQTKIDNWDKKPDFDGKTTQIKAGQTLTLTDNKGVLKEYNAFSYTKDGITVKHSAESSKLTVTAASDCSRRNVSMTENDLKSAGGEKYSSKAAVNYVYSADTSQDLATYGNTVPVGLSLSFDVDIVQGKIAIEKTKSADGWSDQTRPEEGAVFQVYQKSAGSYEKAETERRALITTDSAGKGETKLLPHGIYRVRQIKGAEGHKFVPDFDVTIDTGEDNRLYRYKLNNETLKSKLRLVKKDGETGKVIPLSGAVFKVKNLDTGKWVVMDQVSAFVTDKSGAVILPQALYYGSYQVEEIKAPSGYIRTEKPTKFQIDGSKELVEVVIENVPKKGVISVEKTGEVLKTIEKKKDGTHVPIFQKGGLTGAEYTVTAAEDIVTKEGTLKLKKGERAAIVATAGDGKAKTEPLYLGKYHVRETKAPNGYVLNRKVWSVDLCDEGQETSLSSARIETENERQKVRITLTKALELDVAYGYGKEIYEEIQFGLFAKEDISAADGTKIPAKGLVEKIHLTEGDSTGVYNGICKADLPGGRYYIKEIRAPEGYVENDTLYPVDFSYAGQETELVKISVNQGKPIENRLIRSQIRGKKISDDQKNLKGAIVGLFKKGETNFTMHSALVTDTTDAEGKFSFENVPYGKYLVREIKAPEGCLLNRHGYPVSVDQNGAVIQVKMVNQLSKGYITIEKEAREIFMTVLKNEEECYTPVFRAGGLAGAEYTITAAEDIITADQVVRHEKGEVVDRIITGSDGKITTSALHLGKYAVKETKAPDGYVVDPTVHQVELKYAGQEVEIVGADIKAINDRQKVKITVTKKLEPDSAVSVEEKAYADIVFGLFAEKEIMAADGSIIPAGGLIEKIGVTKLKQDGTKPLSEYTGTFSSNLPVGAYYVQEIETAEGYILDGRKYPAEFVYAGQEVELVHISVNDGKPIENKLMRGTIKGHKTTKEGADLADAVIGLFQKGEKEFTEEKAVSVAVSDYQGKFTFSGTAYGEYVVAEIAAPAGYVLSEERIPVIIDKDGAVVSVEMINDRLPVAPKTGDEKNLPAYTGICLGAMVIFAMVLSARRKVRKRHQI